MGMIENLAPMLEQHTETLSKLEQPFEFELVEGSIKGAVKEAGGGSADLWKVPIDSIRLIDGFQPKVRNKSYEAAVRELADSMKQIGWLTNSALAGFAAKDPETGKLYIYLVDGHTRLLAVKLAISEGAEFQTVPIIIRTKGVSMDDLNVNLARGHKERGLSPYELGVVIKRLANSGHSEETVQAMTGITAAWYDKLMKLMAAPEKLKVMVAFEYVSATLAIDLIIQHGGKKALAMLEEAQVKKAGPDATPEQAGKTKVQARNLTKTPHQKQVAAEKREAPKLHAILQDVKKDPAFVSLSPELREKLDGLLAQLKQATEVSADEASSAAPADTSVPEPKPQQALFDEQAHAATV